MSQHAQHKGTHFLLQAKARTLSLRDIYTAGEDAAFETFCTMRWPETDGEPVCPKCGGLDAYKITTRRKFKCKHADCHHQFSPTSGTIIHSRKMAYVDLLAAVCILVNGAKSQHSILECYDMAIHSNSQRARYRQSLLACALATTDELGYFAPSAILHPLGTILGRPVVLADVQKHLDRFASKEHGQILARIGTSKRYRYRFAEPIMQPYVIMRGIHEKLIGPRSKSLLSYNPQRSLAI